MRNAEEERRILSTRHSLTNTFPERRERRRTGEDHITLLQARIAAHEIDPSDAA
jgi:hypothetical protein